MHTNRLVHESSPYLLQHAHNPVDWYPWGEEALNRAIAEDKPILVSIGYAACHWCHVMERESFENDATAQIMNQHFINIKIDREERPDLDHLYMDAVQAMTGSGGWPLNVFLTPDRKPFYGGTYFPPVKAFNRASWTEVLEGIRKGYQDRREEIETQANHLTQHLQSSNLFGFQTKTGDATSGIQQLTTITENLLAQADKDWGGFGRAPKFPQTFSIQFLLRQYHFYQDQAALDQALLSLDKMIQGGIYDQLGGGFARYSTDTQWLAPHFEKMLYDNALLISVLSEAYQLTQNPVYAKVINQTIGFLERELLDQEGGYYSALDADSEGVEGKFYTWSKAEIDALLGKDAALFCQYYRVEEQGNWEHVNILWTNEPAVKFALSQGLDLAAFQNLMEQCGQILMNARDQRIRPGLDDKILLGWNALLNTAYSKAFAALGNESYRQQAISHMAFLEKTLQQADGSWHHTYKKGIAKLPAFLDDYAYLIQAYIHLQEITGNQDYLVRAKELTDWVCTHFSEPETGFFYFTHQDQQDILVRKKEVYDGATPSGNAVMCANLLYLSLVFDLPEFKERAMAMLGALENAIVKYPGSFGVWAGQLQIQTKGVVELAITGKNWQIQVPQVLQAYIPHKIIQWGETNLAFFPLLVGRESNEDAAFYICKDYSCKAPIFNIADFLANV
ncbi:MAG: thioredoxin domain-containing protein [Bacteroidetes bacterium 24-39-8]|jgi:uncharacterized protein YyaL (SSP411 family)|nr:MAG: thioredoxin domain-containing protein [Bacteroidetes bacterium 24-39-8]OZA65342.1 MAG: thioredoxin domain-containing protein [Sphingobacteriia bacterium 39-39-8]HQR92130.1 thioredoxin domain-containing protein [Sediminibacterium sp.]HQS53772.1 thioredoxin domain-containing protein [Sediminibacterium sp.]